MKIFPIKVEKAVQPAFKFIAWKMHNVCNYNCSFCPSHIKDGKERWFTLEKYKEYIDKLVETNNGMPLRFQLTGGEPTLFPDFIPLVKYMKSKGIMVSVLTNGIRTIRWWKELKEANAIDYLFLTYHTEQTTDYQHIAEVANLFHNEPVEVVIFITHIPDTIELAFESQKYLLENTGSIISIKAMIIDVNLYKPYTKEQEEKYESETWSYGKLLNTKVKPILPPEFQISHKLNITNNDGSSYIIDVQNLLKKNKIENQNYKGWDCNIGAFAMQIDYETVYRGQCGEGEKQSLYDDNISFTNDYITCSKEVCWCSSDIISTKILPKGMYPEA
jgi:organic radical activating enzyme